MNITITEVSRGKQQDWQGRVAIYAMTADGAVYRHNWLCHTWREAGDGYSEEAETIHLAQEYGIESDEWTLVRDPRPANPGQRLAIEEVSAGNIITTDNLDGTWTNVYVKVIDGSVWRFKDSVSFDHFHGEEMSHAEYLMNAVFDLGSINPQHWTQVREGVAA